MPVTPKPVASPPVYLLSRSGARFYFASLEHLSRWLSARVSRSRAAYRRWNISIGREFDIPISRHFPTGKIVYAHFDYVLTDENGNKLDPSLIPSPSWAERWKAGQYRMDSQYRREPVPRLRRRRSFKAYYRRPQTAAARRQAWVCVEDGEPAVRGARSARMIPTAWADKPRHITRNWKKHRKTQWKPKG